MDEGLNGQQPDHEPVPSDAAILVGSAHWQNVPFAIGATAGAALDRGDVDALAAFRCAPAVRYAHPTGYWLGLAKRSVHIA